MNNEVPAELDCTTDQLDAFIEVLDSKVEITITNNGESSCNVGVELWTYEDRDDQTFLTGKYLTIHGAQNGRDNTHKFTIPVGKLKSPECKLQIDAFINDGVVGSIS